MGKAIRASLLIVLFACSAQAGYIPNDVPTPPPPPQPISVDSSTQPTNTVEGSTADGWVGDDAAASLTQVALDLLAVWPSLL